MASSSAEQHIKERCLPWYVSFPDKVSKVNCALNVSLKPDEDSQMSDAICVLTTFHTIITKKALEFVRRHLKSDIKRSPNECDFSHFVKLVNEVFPEKNPSDAPTQSQIDKYTEAVNKIIHEVKPEIARLDLKDGKLLSIPIESVVAGIFQKEGLMDAVLLKLDTKNCQPKIQPKILLTKFKPPASEDAVSVVKIKPYPLKVGDQKNFYNDSSKWIYLRSSEIKVEFMEDWPIGKAQISTSNSRDIDSGDSGSPIYEKDGNNSANLIGMVITKHIEGVHAGSIYMTSIIVDTLLKDCSEKVTHISLLLPKQISTPTQAESVPSVPVGPDEARPLDVPSRESGVGPTHI